MSDEPKFKCKSEAQKRAIRAYYARKRQGGAKKQAKEKYERKPKCRSIGIYGGTRKRGNGILRSWRKIFRVTF